MTTQPESQSREVPPVPGSGVPAPTIPGDVVEMLDLLAHTIVQALGFEVAAINLARADGSLEVVSVAGNADARAALLGNIDTAEAWDRLLAASEPWGRLRFADHHHGEDFRDDLEWIPDFVPLEGEDAWHPEDSLFAPLMAEDGSRLGVLSVDVPNDGRRPNAATRRALEAFAVSVALAIEHATLRARAQESEQLYKDLALRDPLTGVGNRILMLERLRHACTERLEADSVLGLIFVDLDGFKVINDTRSHEVGDLVLREVAHRLVAAVRPHDTVARWGGDEFLVLLERVGDQGSGVDIAQRVADAVAEPIPHAGGDLALTASVGIAFRDPADDVPAEELVRRADKAMYEAKRSGRGGVATHGAGQAGQSSG